MDNISGLTGLLERAVHRRKNRRRAKRRDRVPRNQSLGAPPPPLLEEELEDEPELLEDEELDEEEELLAPEELELLDDDELELEPVLERVVTLTAEDLLLRLPAASYAETEYA